MRYALSRTSAPTSEPVTLAEAKLHCRVDNSVEDSYIESLIAAAREWAESYTSRAFITQQYTLYMDRFPSDAIDLVTLHYIWDGRFMYLPRSPVQSVDEIRYTDTSESVVTLDASRYRVDTKSHQPRIEPAYGDTWPPPLAVSNAVEVDFTAGYGTADDVPASIKHAIKILVKTWYDPARQAVDTVNVSEVPMSAEALLGPYKLNAVPNP